MTINLCNVSGTMVTPAGQPLARAQVRFLPAPPNARGAVTNTVVPSVVLAETDATASLSVPLHPGVYTVRTRDPNGREYPPYLVDVPIAPEAELSRIMVPLSAPQTVYDASASARRAEKAAADAEMARDSYLSPEQFGAVGDGVTDDAGALQAMFEASAMTGRPWRMARRYFAGTAQLTIRTGGDGSGAEIITTAAGQTVQSLVISPLPGDERTADGALATQFNALLPLARGTQRIPGLAPWVGHTVRLFSATPMVNRFGSASPYRHEVFFEVLDDDGHIWPPLPFDLSETVTFSAEKTPLRDWIDIRMPTVRVATGETDRVGLVRVERARVNVRGGMLINETPARLTTGFSASYTTSVRWWGCHVSGARHANTNYGWNMTGAGFELHGCSEDFCRRGVDASYGIDIKLVGGRYPDGIGAHLAFGMSAQNASLGTNEINNAPVRFAGADVSVTGCEITVRQGALLESRTDVSYLAGAIRLSGNRIAFEGTDKTGGYEWSLVRISGPSATFDSSRPMRMPELIEVAGNHVCVSGKTHAGRVAAVLLASGMANLTQGVIIDGDIDVRGNRLSFENGAPRMRIELAKQANFTGRGWRLNVRDVEDLNIWAGAHSGAGGQAARLDIFAQNIGHLALRPDFGAVRMIQAHARTHTSSQAFGLHPPVGDESWAVGLSILAGEYGVGGDVVNYGSATRMNYDAADATAFIGNTSNTAGNVPQNGPGGNHAWSGWMARISHNRAAQFLLRTEIGTTLPGAFFRSMSGGAWGPWRRMLHDGMTLPSTQPSTPNTFWRDAANGNVVRLTPPS